MTVIVLHPQLYVVSVILPLEIPVSFENIITFYLWTQNSAGFPAVEDEPTQTPLPFYTNKKPSAAIYQATIFYKTPTKHMLNQRFEHWIQLVLVVLQLVFIICW